MAPTYRNTGLGDYDDPAVPSRELDGHEITIEPLAETLYDRDDVGPMWLATFEDGSTFHLFDDEVEQ